MPTSIRHDGRYFTSWSAVRWSVTLVYVLVTVPRDGALTSAQQDRYPNRTESACFLSSVTKTLVASCPSRHMVSIVSLFYGHSTSGACAYRHGDCVLSDFLLHTCVGRQVCAINLPSGDLGRQIPHCRLYSNYMQLVYQCVPDAEVHDVCRAGTLTAQAGYLRTPAYPNNYPASRRCTASVAVLPAQRLRLQVVDLDLQSEEAGCADMLYIQDSFRSSTLCGVRRHNQVFTTVGNKLNLTFISDAAGHNKGFWLYYQAFPYIPPTTAPPTSTPPLPTPPRPSMPGGGGGGDGSESVLPPGSSTPQTESSLNVTQSEGRIPLEAVVGGLLGALLCILLVLLILLLIKRRKEREALPASASTCFLHSKASGRAPCIQNNLALVGDSPMC